MLVPDQSQNTKSADTDANQAPASIRSNAQVTKSNGLANIFRKNKLIQGLKAHKLLGNTWSSIFFIVLFSFTLIVFAREWVTLKPQFGGDWHFVFNNKINEFFSIPQLWDGSEGLGQSTANRANLEILNLFMGIFFKITGLGFKASEILFWFLPFVLFSFLGTYNLAKLFTYEKRSAAIAGLFYTLNPYTLVLFSTAGHINILLAYSLVPLMIKFLIQFTNNRTLKNLLLYSLTLSAIMIYDVRIGYISLILQLIFFIYAFIPGFTLQARKLSNLIQSFTLAGFLLILINLFWIGAILLVPKDTLLPQGFENPDWVNRLSFQDVSHGIFLDHPFMTNDGVTYFKAHEVRVVFILITAIIFIGLSLSKPKQFQKQIPWIFVWVIGIFFLKGINPPFGEVYLFLYKNFPGFNMLREPQKWYFMVVLPYVILFSSSISVISNFLMNKFKNRYLGEFYKITNFGLHWIAVGIIAITLIPLFTNKLDENFRAREIPEYATDIEDIINKDEDEFYRVLWIPKATSAAYKTDRNPRVDAFVEIAEYLGTENDQDVYDFFFSDKFKLFLEDASIKYIVFPNEEAGFQWFSKDFRVVASYFQKSDYLKPISEGKYAIFENTNYKPLFYASTRAVLTDDSIDDINLDENTISKVDIIRTEKQIDSTISNFSDKNYNLSSLNKIRELSNGHVESNFVTVAASRFDIEDIDTARYYNISFRNINGNFSPVLTQIQEMIRINDEEEIGTTESKTIEFPDIQIPGPSTNTVVKYGDDFVEFSPDEVRNGISKGSVYHNYIQSETGDENKDNPTALKLEIFSEQQEYYIENFNEIFEYKLHDCRNETGTPLKDNGINAEFVRDAYEGEYALRLQANRQNGCVNAEFSIDNTPDLLITKMAYKAVEGKSPEYCIFDFENNKCAIRHALLNASNEEWKTDASLFSIDENAKKFALYFYADAEQSRTTNIYDNFSVRGLSKQAELTFDYNEKTEEITKIKKDTFIEADLHKMTYKSDVISQIPITNFSFEQPVNYDLYVSDCANADQTSLNANKIKATQLNDFTEGRFSLKIEGINHSACYAIPVGRLTENYSYFLQIDMKSDFETLNRVCIFNRATSQCDFDRVFDESDEWNTINAVFNTLESSGNYELYVYSYSTQGDGSLYASYFDNIRLYQIPKNFLNRFKIFAENENKRDDLTQVPEITYEKVSNTRYIVKTPNIDEKFLLNFNMQFDSGWSLYKYSGTDLKKSSLATKIKLGSNFSKVDDIYHIKTNNFMNSWYIEQEGDQIYVLEYRQQSVFTLLTFMSLTTVFGSTALLFSIFAYERRKKNGGK